MGECISPPVNMGRMNRLAERIEAEMGLSFPEAKRRELQSAMHRMAEAEEFDNDEACIDWLLSGNWDKRKCDLCGLHLTVGETYFFREPRAFELVADYARKKMREEGAGNRHLRIWSAGCCTGEEPYSIAMALKQALPELNSSEISILATDINTRHLQIARAGVYRQWSFRNTATALQNRHFSRQDENLFRIDDEIRTSVRFAELNLAADVYPSIASGTHAQDIIFCRNVLMYFSREQARKVIARFRHCLVEGGWLIVNPSEASSELFAGFTGHYYPDAIYFQKRTDGHAAQPSPPMPSIASQPGPDAEPLHSSHLQTASRKRKSRRQTRPVSKPGRIAPVVCVGHDAADTDAVITARALANEGQADAALRYLERAIHAGRPTVELYHAKALIAMEAGASCDAVQSLKRVIYLQPDFIPAHYLLGVLQAAEHRHGEAVRQFKVTDELLASLADGDIVPGSDGLHVAYLRESVRAYLRKGG